MGDQNKSESSSDHKELTELSGQLDRVQRQRQEKTGPAQRQPNPLGFAFRLISELVAAVGVGIAIGWLLDKWLNTGPFLTLVFFMLGAAAGVLNVYRTVERAHEPRDRT